MLANQLSYLEIEPRTEYWHVAKCYIFERWSFKYNAQKKIDYLHQSIHICLWCNHPCMRNGGFNASVWKFKHICAYVLIHLSYIVKHSRTGFTVYDADSAVHVTASGQLLFNLTDSFWGENPRSKQGPTSMSAKCRPNIPTFLFWFSPQDFWNFTLPIYSMEHVQRMNHYAETT